MPRWCAGSVTLCITHVFNLVCAFNVNLCKLIGCSSVLARCTQGVCVHRNSSEREKWRQLRLLVTQMGERTATSFRSHAKRKLLCDSTITTSAFHTYENNKWAENYMRAMDKQKPPIAVYWPPFKTTQLSLRSLYLHRTQHTHNQFPFFAQSIADRTS